MPEYSKKCTVLQKVYPKELFLFWYLKLLSYLLAIFFEATLQFTLGIVLNDMEVWGFEVLLKNIANFLNL